MPNIPVQKALLTLRMTDRAVQGAAWITLAAAGGVLAWSIYRDVPELLTVDNPSDKAMPKSRSATPAIAANEPGRGRHADHPGQIPAAGWKDILTRTAKEFRDDNLMLISAGVTFYSLLAFFPGVAAFAAIYGLFADMHDVRDQVQALARVLPADVVKFVADQMTLAATAKPAGLSFAFFGGLAVSIWSANGAVKAVIMGLNIAYEEREHRNFIMLTLRSLSFTIGALALLIAVFLSGVASQLAARFLGGWAEAAVSILRWPILGCIAILATACLYRYGPSREKAKWRWITGGSVFVTVLWVLASVGLSLYLGKFAHYNTTYGPLGAVMAFIFWIYVSTAILLVGAELNAEIEHQTLKDTTTNPEQPIGARGAQMADTVGAAQ